MNARLFILGSSILFTAAPTFHAQAQSKIPGAPSNAPPRVTDATGHAEGIADKIEAVFQNVQMLADYVRQEKIAKRLEDYLKQMGAKPTPGEIHLFHVRALIYDSGYVELKDFQYLTKGKTVEDALRESFTLDNAPASRIAVLIHWP